MPCMCWEDEGMHQQSLGELRNKVNELAVRECRLSMLLADLVRLLGFENLTSEQQTQYREAMARHKKHREGDKKDAIRETEQKINKLQRDIKQVKKLGGNPGRLTVELKTLKALKTKITASDPMTTTLY